MKSYKVTRIDIDEDDDYYMEKEEIIDADDFWVADGCLIFGIKTPGQDQYEPMNPAIAIAKGTWRDVKMINPGTTAS